MDANEGADPAPLPDEQEQPVEADDDDHVNDDLEYTLARTLQIILQYNGRMVHDALPPGAGIPDDAWTRFPRRRPFPFNLESTWYMAASFALLLAVFAEIDTSWAARSGFLDYLGRIAYGVSGAVAIAALSALMYDVIGALVELAKRTELAFYRSTGVRWWERLGNPWYLPRELFDLLLAASLVTLDLFRVVIFVKAKTMPYLGMASTYAVDRMALFDDFLGQNWNQSVVPILDTYETARQAYGWEVLPQIALQIWIASFLYIVVTFLKFKAREPIIDGSRIQDPLCCIVYFLVHATALHLLANTAYQVLRLAIDVSRTTPVYAWLGNWLFTLEFRVQLFNPYIILRTVYADIVGHIVAAAVLYIVQTLIIYGCRLTTTIIWPFWRQYIVWLTPFVGDYLDEVWPGFYDELKVHEEQLVRLRLNSRVIMSLLFGTRSSWPARTAFYAGPRVPLP